jgi:hypothetical protein
MARKTKRFMKREEFGPSDSMRMMQGLTQAMKRLQREERSAQTTEQAMRQLSLDLKSWTPDQKAHIRAKLNRAYGQVKESGGKPS